jgi:hypothetical protein
LEKICSSATAGPLQWSMVHEIMKTQRHLPPKISN